MVGVDPEVGKCESYLPPKEKEEDNLEGDK